MPSYSCTLGYFNKNFFLKCEGKQVSYYEIWQLVSSTINSGGFPTVGRGVLGLFSIVIFIGWLVPNAKYGTGLMYIFGY